MKIDYKKLCVELFGTDEQYSGASRRENQEIQACTDF